MSVEGSPMSEMVEGAILALVNRDAQITNDIYEIRTILEMNNRSTAAFWFSIGGLTMFILMGLLLWDGCDKLPHKIV